MAASGGQYKGGSFAVPGGTGAMSVTGIGFRPQVVLFFGSNSGTLNTVLTGGQRALMRGCMARDDVSGTIKSWCMSPIMHDAVRWEQKPIVCCNDGNANTAYEASAVSLDADGFTVSFSVVQASRTIHYVAIGAMDHSTAGIHTGRANYTIGWEPFSGLHLGGLDDTIQDSAGANREASTWGHMLTLGGASWPLGAGNALSRRSMHLQLTDTPFGNQTRLVQFLGSGSTSYVGMGDHFLGPFMVDGAHEQYPASVTQVQRGVDTDNQGHFVELDAYSDTGSVSLGANVNDDVTITSSVTEVEEPALILFLSILGVPAGANAGPNAAMFGFWTPEHQYVVAANGVDGSFYQNSGKAWVSKLTTAGVHAGRCDAVGPGTPGAILTTEVAGVTGGSLVWHMFGPNVSAAWIPHIYRLVMPT